MDRIKYIWSNSDMAKAIACSLMIGFLIGVCVGYDLGFEPKVVTFKPLMG
jgi:hypothetical protein